RLHRDDGEALAHPLHAEGEGRLLGPLLFVFSEDPILDEFPSLVVDGMRDVLVSPIRTLPTGHRHEHAVRPFDDLESSNDERVVRWYARRGLSLPPRRPSPPPVARQPASVRARKPSNHYRTEANPGGRFHRANA